MNRIDRLYAPVEELRAVAPRPVSATRLAERFEVSVRTIERDILALQESGVPVWSERGRTGGYALDSRATLPPLNLDPDEALAVMVALAAMPAVPFSTAGRRARQKVLAVMRPDDADTARRLAGRLRLSSVDRADAGDTVAPEPALLTAVEHAVRDRLVVRLDYADADGATTTERPVEVHGLHLNAEHAYLVGWCRLRDDGRVFRLDRIRAIALTDEVAPVRDLDEVLDVPFPTIRPDA